MKYAFYSLTAAQSFGSSIYLNEKGEEVELTGIWNDPEYKEYCWADKVCRGELGDNPKWLRRGVKGMYEDMFDEVDTVDYDSYLDDYYHDYGPEEDYEDEFEYYGTDEDYYYDWDDDDMEDGYPPYSDYEPDPLL